MLLKRRTCATYDSCHQMMTSLHSLDPILKEMSLVQSMAYLLSSLYKITDNHINENSCFSSNLSSC